MQRSSGVGFLAVLTIVFVVLKLTGTVNWSWWLVLLPTLINIGLFALAFAVAVLALLLGGKK